MTLESDERQPLLSASRPDDDQHIQTSSPSTGPAAALLEAIRQRWPVYRLLFVTLLMFSCGLSTFSEQVELSRALACAEFYQRFSHTNDVTLTLSNESEQDLCSDPWIEKRSAQAVEIIYISANVLSLIIIVLVQPRLHRIGVKFLFLLSTAFFLLDKTSYFFLPLGYPYGDVAERMTVTPIWSRRIFLFFTCASGLFGGESVPKMCLRIFITNISTIEDRTQNLINMQLMNLISLSIAPATTAWLGSLIPFSFRYMSGKLLSIVHHLQSLAGVPLSLQHFADMPPPNVPPSSGGDARIEPTNLAPFLIANLIVIVTLFSGYCFIPADQGGADADAQTDITQPNRRSGKKDDATAAPQDSMFYRLWPRRDKDGRLDWRILLIFLTISSQMSSAYSLILFIQYFGHALRWSQEAVAGLISAVGVSRVVVVLVVVPIWTAYYERTVKRPSALRTLTLDQIKNIAKDAPAGEAPAQSAYDVAIRGDQGDQDEIASIAQHEDLRGAVSTWRARVDRGVLHLSFLSDIIGWFTSGLFTITQNVPMILVGGAIAALGGASVAVRSGVELVIVGDVLARTAEGHDAHISASHDNNEDDGNDEAAEDVGASTQTLPNHRKRQQDVEERASELYFALLGFTEGFSLVLSPIFATWVYNRTSGAYASLNWFLAALCYVLAYLFHFSMPIHKSSPSRSVS